MHERRRRVAAGMILAALVAGGTWTIGADGPRASAAGAQAAPPTPLGSVTAGGALQATEPGWHAERVGVGTYRLDLPADTTVALRAWTAVATVTARPLSPTAWMVTFTTPEEQPVDSAFTFLAPPAG